MTEIKQQMLNEETHRQCNCFCLTVMAHGDNKGFLLDVNKGGAMNIEQFTGDLANVKTLKGKPKILILQACRGNKYGKLFMIPEP